MDTGLEPKSPTRFDNSLSEGPVKAVIKAPVSLIKDKVHITRWINHPPDPRIEAKFIGHGVKLNSGAQ